MLDCEVRRSLISPDITIGMRRGILYKKVYYVPSQLQRSGISYAESKTECQPTNHCKQYS